MASAKKTVKSSKAKQAKQIGTAKTKSSRQSAELKGKRAAAARALTIRTRAASKVSRPKSTASPAAGTRQRSEATAKSVLRKKVSAARATSRSEKKTAVTRRAKTARSGTPAAGQRATSKTVSSGASSQVSTGRQPRVRQASTRPQRTASNEPVRRVPAKLAATVGKAVATPSRGAQKPAANKAAAAAILALKRKSPALGKAGGSSSAQPALKSSSRPNVAANERGAIIKGSSKSLSAPRAGSAAESSASRLQTGEGLARVASPGNFNGRGRPFAAAPRNPQPLLSGLSRSEASATILAAGQTKTSKPGLPGQSMVPAQKPVRTANLLRPPFKLGEYVVYPSHGVGQIVAIEEQEVAGFTLELFVLSFVKDKMTLKVPVTKAASVGMRKLADTGTVKAALDTLSGRARTKRTMWSRRAQEYEAKINSGDLNAIAEVVRDLYRSDTQPEQSYSERQLYEAALDRMAREIIVVQKLTETESLKVIEAHLQKGPRRGKVDDSEVEEADIEEAA
jgi:CarD family transcriptional regulator